MRAFAEHHGEGRIVLERPFIEAVALTKTPAQDTYLYEIPAVRHLLAGGKLVFGHAVTILVGENGTGKSTLTEGIAVAYGFNAEGGSKNFRFSTNRSHSELGDCLTLTKKRLRGDGYFLRAESFYNVATHIDELDRQPAAAPPIIGGYGGVSLHEQSHGESFMSLVRNRLSGAGLYIWDEPEAALSPMRQLELLREMDRLVKCGSQLIIATHSPLLMAYPDAEILLLSQEGIRAVSYRETEHYLCSKAFFDDPERTMYYLLKDDVK